MPKRGSENSQIRKEDYDDGGQDDDKGRSPDDGGAFKRASASAMAKRRIVSASKRSRPSSSSPTGGNTSGGIFAGVSLVAPAPQGGAAAAKKTTKSVGFSFGSSMTTPAVPTPAPPVVVATADVPSTGNKTVGFSLFGGATPAAAAKPTTANAGATPFVFGASGTPAATPGFSFGSSKTPTEASGTNKPFSFGGATPAAAPPTPATGGFLFGAVKPTTTTTTTTTGVGGGGGGGNNQLVERFQKHAIALENAFYNECAQIPVTTTYLLPILDHVLDAAYVLETEYWKRVDTKEYTTNNKSVSFGGFASAGPGASTPGTGGSWFGAPPPTPAPPSFGGGGAASSTTTPDTNAAVGGGGGGEEDGGPSESCTDKATVAAPAADEGYETVATLEGTVYFYIKGKEDEKSRMQVKGMAPKIQLHRDTKKLRLVMRNDASGKVLVNMSVRDDLQFSTQKSKKHINGIEGAITWGILSEDLRGQGAKQITMTRSVRDPSMKNIFADLFQRYPQN